MSLIVLMALLGWNWKDRSLNGNNLCTAKYNLFGIFQRRK